MIRAVCVQPVKLLSAVFCIACSLCVRVLAMSEDHDVFAYMRMGLMKYLYSVMTTLECPYVV